MYGWIVLAACQQAPDLQENPRTSVYPATHSAEGDPTMPTGAGDFAHVKLDVVARVSAPGEPGAWTARVAIDAPFVERNELGCQPIPREAGGVEAVSTLRLDGVASGELAWEPLTGHWTAAGPGGMRDPAWSIGSLEWRDDDRAHVAVGAVRFGGVPSGARALREREGDVYVEWDASTADATEILVVGPGGAVVCAAEGGSVRLPWWALPPSGGEVVLRSTRTQHLVVDDVLVYARTTIERIIPLDRPSGTTADEKEPRFQLYSPAPARRLTRAWRGPVG